MTLFRAELARIAHRRLTRATLAVIALGLALIGVTLFLTHSSQAPDLTLAEAQARHNTESCIAGYGNDSGMTTEAIEQSCYSDPAWFVQDRNFHLQSMLVGNGSEPFATASDQARSRDLYPELGGERSAAYGYTSTLAGLGILITVAAAVLGASYVGADWRSGVIESQLVRQPRRSRLFAAKFGAIALTSWLLATLTAALTMVAVLPAARWRGDMANTGPDFWLAAAGMIGRIGVAAVLCATIAAGITMVARNTAAGIGIGLAAFIVGGIIPALGGEWTPWFAVPGNLGAWIAQGDVSYTYTIADPTGGLQYYDLMGHSWLMAGLLLTATAAAIVALGHGTFARRDVS